MTLYYLDASGWVKRYFEERGSDAIRKLFADGDLLAASSLGYVEVAATLARRGHGAGLPQEIIARMQAQLDQDWAELIEVRLEPEVLINARDLAPAHRLRGADAIHLAAALSLANRLGGEAHTVMMITSDHELIAASLAVGLPAQDPSQ